MNQRAAPPAGQKPTEHDDEHPDLSAKNARAGLWIFSLYLLAYAIFIRLAAASPELLGQETSLGLNVAVVYGFGLILGAVALALVYMRICDRNASSFSPGEWE